MPRILLRQDVAVNWTTANPILARGEPGLDLDTATLRVGDGTTPWALLPLFDPLSGQPRVLAKGGAWLLTIEGVSSTGVFSIRAVGPGPVTKLLTWDPVSNAVTAGGKPLATQEYVSARLDSALVVGPVLLS